MKDEKKTRDQLTHELAELRQRIDELEGSETNPKQAGEGLPRPLVNLSKAMGTTVRAMALTIETRDPFTAGHQRRVADLARAIAREMGLSNEQIDGIGMAGVIHDLGKISVPAEILSKPGRLTEIEFKLIKTHPLVGYRILKRMEFPWSIAQMVLQHHERSDSSGYPAGLPGEEILMEARILGVADVVEAMSSHRPYLPALGIDKALEEISWNSGFLYDPSVVDACLTVFTEKGFGFEDSDFAREREAGSGLQPHSDRLHQFGVRARRWRGTGKDETRRV